MTEIPGWVWILIGGVITYISAKMGNKFALFFFLGVFFVLYGAYKIISVRGKHHVHNVPAQHTQSHTKHMIHYLHCPRCTHLVRSVDFFCWRCGHKLR